MYRLHVCRYGMVRKLLHVCAYVCALCMYVWFQCMYVRKLRMYVCADVSMICRSSLCVGCKYMFCMPLKYVSMNVHMLCMYVCYVCIMLCKYVCMIC